ncbi:MAG: single-stranded DNA-binding protein [Chitinispirillaceae bacterium]|jgi:single-strand DNA-binding protein
MLGVNKVILIGNLGKDPELRYTPSGQPTASFSLATTERWNDKNGQRQERTEWHNIVAWGKLAELVNQYLKKGRSAYVEGRINTRSWDDRDGNKKYRTEIVASQIQFLGGGGTPSAGSPAAGAEAAPDTNDGASKNNNEAEAQSPVVEENLPF